MKHSFTLIELLTVIAIIAILAGMLIPAVGKARNKAQVARCLGNQRQLLQGAQMYANDWKQFLPCTDEAPAGNPGDFPTGQLIQRTGNNRDMPYANYWWKLDDANPGTAYEANRSWAGKIYGVLKDPGVFFCPAATVSNENMMASSYDRKHGLSYLTCYEVSRLKLDQVKNADSAIYCYDNNSTANTAYTYYFSRYRNGNNAKVLYSNMWVPGTSLTYPGNDWEIISRAHDGVMNAGFVDGHATSAKYGVLIEECIVRDKRANDPDIGNEHYLHEDYYFISL
ncbi:MAG: type II secretion system protein [Victivallales bacterium]|nr:type II secretion system protein [Victivallales bacterium]